MTRRLVLQASAVTMTADYVDGREAVVIEPFPADGDGPEVVIVGTIEELRGISSDLDSLLDGLTD